MTVGFLRQHATRAFVSDGSSVISDGNTVDRKKKKTFKYSTKRFKNATKCSAFLIFPGIASLRRSSGRTNSDMGLAVVCRHRGPTWVCHEAIGVSIILRCLLQTFNKFSILILQFCGICYLNSVKKVTDTDHLSLNSETLARQFFRRACQRFAPLSPA